MENHCVKLELEIEVLREEKADTLAQILEIERQIQLWERKIKLEESMQTIIKPEKGIKEIEENLELISENLPSSSKEFKSMGLVKDGIYKRLETSIQNLIDIFSMIYSSSNFGVPSSLDDIFDGLLENKVLPKKVIVLVNEMKGLRNILVHRYGKIDDALVYDLLKERLGDFDTIILSVDKFLQK